MANFGKVEKIEYKGARNNRSLAFRYYNADEPINGKAMRERLCFVLPWRTLSAVSGGKTSGAKEIVFAAFELMEKLGAEYFSFSGADLAPRQERLLETNRALDGVAELVAGEMERTGIKCRFGAADCFCGGLVKETDAFCNATVFAYAAAQVKKAMELTKRLGGEGFVFRGGFLKRDFLLCADAEFESDNMARLLKMAVSYAHDIDFSGRLAIELLSIEPTECGQQLALSAALAFLRKYGLSDDFKLVIKTGGTASNLRGELSAARQNGMFGGVSVMLDGFSASEFDLTLAMNEIFSSDEGLCLEIGTDETALSDEELFGLLISGMDTFAKAFKAAARLTKDGALEALKEERYASFRECIGKDIISGRVGFKELEAYAIVNGVTPCGPADEESLKNTVSQCLLET